MLQPEDAGAALRRWVYVDQGEDGLLGFIVVMLLRVGGEVQAEIENLAVSPVARRRGTGTGLCRRALQELGAAGAKVVELEVRAGNAAALALYRGLGFETTGMRADYYSSPTEDAQLLRAQLG
jgi:ribosomal protein S18 acetylase RimI-like enzyme